MSCVCRQVLAGEAEGRLGVVHPQEGRGGGRLHAGLERLVHGVARLGGVHAGGGRQVLPPARRGVRLEQQQRGGAGTASGRRRRAAAAAAAEAQGPGRVVVAAAGVRGAAAAQAGAGLRRVRPREAQGSGRHPASVTVAVAFRGFDLLRSCSCDRQAITRDPIHADAVCSR